MKVNLHDDETLDYARDYRIQVRLAQLLGGYDETQLPSPHDVITAGLIWRRVLLPIANGTSKWFGPVSLSMAEQSVIGSLDQLREATNLEITKRGIEALHSHDKNSKIRPATRAKRGPYKKRKTSARTQTEGAS